MSHIKITGFLFTALAGFLLGFSARRKIYRHAETLARMSDILSRLYSEISYAHSSPEDFFEVLSAENDYIGRFFKTVLDKMRKGNTRSPRRGERRLTSTPRSCA